MDKYLRERGDARVKDWASWVANAKWERRRGARRHANGVAANVQDLRADPDEVNYLSMHTAFRLIVLSVMNENRIDAFVNPEQTTPPYRIGRAPEPSVNGRSATSCCTRLTALMGGPEIEVPAGFVTAEYAPRYVLAPDKTEYTSATGTVETKLPQPMPISLMFWAAPGADPTLVKVASAYEAATHHRKPPPAFRSGEAARPRVSRAQLRFTAVVSNDRAGDDRSSPGTIPRALATASPRVDTNGNQRHSCHAKHGNDGASGSPAPLSRSPAS